MAFSIVLARKGFAAHGTYEGAFVSMCAEVGAEVVCAGETFWAERALECCRVFLDTFTGGARGGRAGWVGEFEDVVSRVMWYRRGRGAAGFVGDAKCAT